MARLIHLMVLLASVLFLVGPAQAVVTGGSVTSGGGVFEKLIINSMTDVGDDNYQSLNLFAFDEDQNIVIDTDIAVDIGTGPMKNDVVASHYVFFDPDPLVRQQGYVDFDANIYGVATSKTNLDDSDFLANTLVNYLSPNLRGLESGDSVWIDALLPNRLRVNWRAGSPGDYVRVFTMESPLAPVPVPAALPLLLAGIAGLTLVARRRKTASRMMR